MESSLIASSVFYLCNILRDFSFKKDDVAMAESILLLSSVCNEN